MVHRASGVKSNSLKFPTRSALCPWLPFDRSTLKQGQLPRGSFADSHSCPPRTAEVSFQVRVFALANRGSDSKPFTDLLHPLISLFAESFWKEFCLRGRTDLPPLSGLETGFNHLSMKRRKLCHQLPFNRRPKMEIAESHPFHSDLLQSSKKGLSLGFRIRDKGNDGIYPYFRKNSNLLEPLNILQPRLRRRSPRFIFRPVSPRERNQPNLSENLLSRQS